MILKTDSKEYYRANLSQEDEQKAIEEKCRDVCVANPQSGVTSCSARNLGIRPFYKGVQPIPGVFPHMQGQASYTELDLPCWAALPTAKLSERPASFLSELEVKNAMEGDCYKCQVKERAALLAKHSVGPDKRFWIGAAAAGLGLVVAVLAGAIRR